MKEKPGKVRCKPQQLPGRGRRRRNREEPHGRKEGFRQGMKKASLSEKANSALAAPEERREEKGSIDRPNRTYGGAVATA